MTSDNNFWLRQRNDEALALERLANHPILTPAPKNRFIIHAENSEIASLLKTASLYAPIPVGRFIDTTVENRTHPDWPEWLGYQKGNSLFLYYPAFRNVTTLFFTFFHELGHWCHKSDEFLNDSDWDNFLMARGKTDMENERELQTILEDFANEFAWFCSYPDFLFIDRPNSYDFFACLLAEKVKKEVSVQLTA